jgi:uncharacterized membrane protein YqjE
MLQDLPETCRDLGEIGSSMLRNRLELFSVELSIEKVRLVRMLVLVAAGVFLALSALALITVGLVLYADPASRPALLLGLGGGYLVAGAVLVYLAVRMVRRHKPFCASIEELDKDVEAFK